MPARLAGDTAILLRSQVCWLGRAVGVGGHYSPGGTSYKQSRRPLSNLLDDPHPPKPQFISDQWIITKLNTWSSPSMPKCSSRVAAASSSDDPRFLVEPSVVAVADRAGFQQRPASERKAGQQLQLHSMPTSALELHAHPSASSIPLPQVADSPWGGCYCRRPGSVLDT